jgi:hypothetical protein
VAKKHFLYRGVEKYALSILRIKHESGHYRTSAIKCLLYVCLFLMVKLMKSTIQQNDQNEIWVMKVEVEKIIYPTTACSNFHWFFDEKIR